MSSLICSTTTFIQQALPVTSAKPHCARGRRAPCEKVAAFAVGLGWRAIAAGSLNPEFWSAQEFAILAAASISGCWLTAMKPVNGVSKSTIKIITPETKTPIM